MMEKKAQMTIFVIIAIILAVGIILFFSFRGKIINVGGVPVELNPVFEYYEGCIEQETKAAINLAESQGGYIDVPEYNPGSEYAPFSSEMNFFGFPVPYWYYVSGNGLIKEQVPSKKDIEQGIERYIEERINSCNFDDFYAKGFEIDFGKPRANVEIDDTRVDVIIDTDLNVMKGDVVGKREEHKVSVSSKLGKFYLLAKKIYEKEKRDAIFDLYGEDVLRLYAPVDGVEISCSGKVWKTKEVIDELRLGLEANIAKIKFKGDYYKLNDKKDEYYVVDLGESVDEKVNLIYNKFMPSKIEIVGDGVDDQLMIASPVGVQEGLGIMGFCYAPYHYVYDFSFPVLVQIYNNEEVFQFPVVAVIDKNVPRKAQFFEIDEGEVSEDICEFKTEDIEVNLYDTNLNKVDGEISYQCFNQRCRLGETKGGKFVGKAPACYNGQLLIKGNDFSEKKEFFSTNKDRYIDVILDKEREVEIELKVGGKPLGSKTAIVSFAGKNGGRTVSTALPEVSRVKLSEGSYDLTVYVYGDSSIIISSSTKTQCTEVPRAGILGFFGSTKEKCFDITVPETKVEYALRGGGKSNIYLLDNQLQNGKLTLEVDEMPLPKNIGELQFNYASFETKGVLIR